MCEKCRRNCDDCKRLVAQYGVSNLNECPSCGHYYHGPKCTCTRGQEEAQ